MFVEDEIIESFILVIFIKHCNDNSLISTAPHKFKY